MPRSYVSVFGSEGDYAPVVGGPSTLFTDNFNRADKGSAGVDGLDPPWISTRNFLGIFSNQLAFVDTAGNDAFYYVNIATANNQWCQWTNLKATSATIAICGALRRQIGDQRNGYFAGHARADTGNLTYDILRYTATSTLAVLVSSAVAPAPGDVCYFEMVGTTLNLKVNGSLACTITDTTYANGSTGVFGTSSASNDPLIDDFSMGNT